MTTDILSLVNKLRSQQQSSDGSESRDIRFYFRRLSCRLSASGGCRCIRLREQQF
jgi:hypothetical protein